MLIINNSDSLLPSDNDFDVTVINSCKDALKFLYDYSNIIDVVLLNMDKPSKSNIDFINKFQNIFIFKKIPLIVTTHSSDIVSYSKLLNIDVSHIIQTRLKGELQTKIENILLKSSLDFYYKYDELTFLYNERTFCNKTKALLKKHKDKQFVIIRFDVQQFKIINDLFGRSEGDSLLIYISDFLRITLNKSSVYGRISNDVFAICTEFLDCKTDILIESINKRLSKYPINFEIIPCFGIYVVENSSMLVEHMLDLANLAAKTIKDNYLKRYAYYSEEIRNSIIGKYEIINDMDSALKNNQFTIYLQPKYNLLTNMIEGCEALVRWIHPTKGLISPDEFIPLFEKNGFIMKLDIYVLEIACKTIRKWLDTNIPPVPVSVNLSRINLYNKNLCNDIISIIKKYDLPMNFIEIEITESAYTKNAKELISIMNTLQNQGLKILMDDFGSGYSSLNMLKDIPVDVLKIDLKFLSNSKNIERSNEILKSVVLMAQHLNIPTIAEGVETKNQLDFLSNIGCTSIQGYYYSRPLPLNDYENFLLSKLSISPMHDA